MKLLRVHPRIYDFTALDFWLPVYVSCGVGGGQIRACELTVFDHLVSRNLMPLAWATLVLLTLKDLMPFFNHWLKMTAQHCRAIQEFRNG
jgi:hypothetical protein